MMDDAAERLAAMTAVRLCGVPAGAVLDMKPGMILDNLAPGESIETIDPNPRGWHCDCCGGPNPSGNFGCVWCGGGTPV